ncbi:MAG TPA: glycosyltransferase family 39 protein [Candidatus Acidoferrales bacterium]|nr:glycosyltransferase family 39 protein [Candidatus Acidoferrales bacterium]
MTAVSRKMLATAILAVSAGLILRFFFVLQFPATGSGDAPFYIELAWNWLRNGVYGFPIAGRLTPVDMRVPGYPAFLAAIFSFAGRVTQPVMFVQVAVDLATCLLVALIAARLAPQRSRRRVALAGLWLAALCPFTANYTAVVLTETLVTFLTALAILVLLETDLGVPGSELFDASASDTRWRQWILGGLIVGFGTLVRPETPLLLLAAGLVLLAKWWRPRNWRKLTRAVLLLSIGLVLPLLPWAARNWRTLHEVQFLAPHYSELPGEFAPLGFDAWINTWLWRFRDVYLVTWKLDVEPISMCDLPASAFDSSRERARVTDVFDRYNDTLTWDRQQDAALKQIARERTARHALRTYLRIPLLRSVTMWFTPRVELLPISGKLWPLREKWQDDRGDFLATLGLAFVNCFYVALALAGAWVCRRQPACAFLFLFVLVRTVYLTTLADEAPEPRYVLECFPAILALGAQVFRGKGQFSSTGSG